MKCGKLDARLQAVADCIEPCQCHVDVGPDHALLGLFLVDYRICQNLVLVEKSPAAFEVAKRAVWGRPVQVYLGDGLAPLENIQAQSLSLCGMGGSAVVKVLERWPERVPDRVVVQANRDSHLVRRWGFQAGFHLQSETLVSDERLYEILAFHKKDGPDPVYSGIPDELAFHFGPLLLRQATPVLRADLERREALHHQHPDNQDLRRVREALKFCINLLE